MSRVVCVHVGGGGVMQSTKSPNSRKDLLMAVINRFSDHTDITLSCLSKGTVAKKAWGGGEVGGNVGGKGRGQERDIKTSCPSLALPGTPPPTTAPVQQASPSK